jgi:hypothetical protein
MAYRRVIPLVFSSLLLGGAAHAAELGEPRISSYRGQPLVADIELAGLDDPAAALQVRVANADVYRGASVTAPPALSSLQLSVVKHGAKQVLHVTSSRPVDTDMLLLFLELGQGASRDVRLATLMLATDPHPAPPPASAIAAVASVPAPPPPVVAAAPLPPPPPAPKPEVRPELPVHMVAAVAPPQLPQLHFAAVSTSLPTSVRSPAPATCKASSANSACAVLDKKNVALQAKLAGLESKIKVLEASLAPAAAVTPATAAPVKPAEGHDEKHAEAPPAAPAPSIVPPIATIKPPAKPVAVLVKPKKPKPVEHPPSSTPWLWIGVAGAIGLAALGAIVFLLLRRRGKPAPPAPGEPKPAGFMASVRDRILPGKKAEPAEAVAESA